MRIWLDCSSLIGWERNHLTGIQRTVLGVHKGWQQMGVTALLYRYDSDIDGFRHVAHADLPELIRVNFENQAWITSTRKTEATVASPQPPKYPSTHQGVETARPEDGRISRLKHSVLGEGDAAEELRGAISAANLSLWRLQRAARKWLRERVDMSRTNRESGNEEPGVKPSTLPGEQISHTDSEDYFFSLGTESYQDHGNIGASNALRKGGGKLIRMIYDTIPSCQPQWVSDDERLGFEAAIMAAMTSCDLILTISEHSRKDLLDFAMAHRLRHPSILPIRLGDIISKPKESEPGGPAFTYRPKRPFFLCLGTIEPRKNHRLLYECWRLLATDNSESCPELVCIGAHSAMCSQLIYEIKRDPLTKERIHLLTDIGDDEIEWYYSNCIATVFPSLYEGWGLPVAESLAKGRMCLASNATSIPEISDLPVFFNPQDACSLRNIIQRTLEEPSWREAVESRIRAEYKARGWLSTAQQVIAAANGIQGCNRAAHEE